MPLFYKHRVWYVDSLDAPYTSHRFCEPGVQGPNCYRAASWFWLPNFWWPDFGNFAGPKEIVPPDNPNYGRSIDEYYDQPGWKVDVLKTMLKESKDPDTIEALALRIFVGLVRTFYPTTDRVLPVTDRTCATICRAVVVLIDARESKLRGV